MAALVISEFSEASLTGAGTFDVLMKAVKVHLEQEFKRGSIKGPEYSTVYLGAMDLAMQHGMGFLLNKRKNDLEAQLLEKEILIANQKYLNAIVENDVLVAQKCKLQAEFDALQAGTLKTEAETLLVTAQRDRTTEEIALLVQKRATEAAQILSTGVDADSIVGRQKALYVAQTNGFTRDAEQKAAKLMADTWSVRRTTDEGTVADATNVLNDAAIGRAINKMLTGVGA